MIRYEKQPDGTTWKKYERTNRCQECKLPMSDHELGDLCINCLMRKAEQ